MRAVLAFVGTGDDRTASLELQIKFQAQPGRHMTPPSHFANLNPSLHDRTVRISSQARHVEQSV